MYPRRLADGTASLELDGGHLRDTESGTRWDPATGRGLAGPLSANTLRQMPAFTAFPDDYRRFFPRGRIWPEGVATSP